MLDKLYSKRELLRYLVGVAQNTQGAEVWRALFSEILAAVEHSISEYEEKRRKDLCAAASVSQPSQ